MFQIFSGLLLTIIGLGILVNALLNEVGRKITVPLGKKISTIRFNNTDGEGKISSYDILYLDDSYIAKKDDASVNFKNKLEEN